MFIAIARALASALLILIVSAAACHADGRIDTDGPDFVESAESLPKGRFQFESGPAFERSKRDAAVRNSVSMPTLLRYGVAPSIEIRMESDIRSRSTESDRASAARSVEAINSDVSIGLKWHSQDRDIERGIASVSWIAHLELPVGDHAIARPGIRPSLRAVIGWDLPNGMTAGLMPGMKYDSSEDGRRYVAGILGATVGKWWTENFRTFVELSANQIAHARYGGVLMAWDLGAAYLVAENWQIGGRFAVAANQNTPSSLLVISLAGRF